MALEVGNILEGTVTGITKFGAFVSLAEGKSGLVHISELSNGYVNDVSEHVSLGQTVKVRVLAITDDGKINLSIKKAMPAPEKPQTRRSPPRGELAAAEKSAASPMIHSPDEGFEDKLKRFMRESDSRMAENRIYSERRQKSRRR